MTYAAEHRGMSSTCPHCQNEVTLGGASPRAVPKVAPNSGQSNTAKIVAWVASCLLVIGLAVAAVVFVPRHKAAAPADAQAIADDGEQYMKTLDEKVGSDLTKIRDLSAQLDAESSKPLSMTVYPLLESYGRIVSVIDKETAPKTDRIKTIKKQMLELYKSQLDTLKQIAAGIEAADDKKVSALVKDWPVQQMESGKKLSLIISSMDGILQQAKRADASVNKISRVQCAQNANAIYLAKRLWASDKNKPDDAIPSESDLLTYLDGNKMPTCPDGGTYTIGSVTNQASCSLPAHAATE